MTTRTLPKPPDSNAQVNEYMKAVRKGVNSQFVMQTREGWSVRPAIEPSDAVLFASKYEALHKAKQEARTKQGEVFVFDQAGALIGQESA